MKNIPRLILASASPRRAELLRDAGFVFAILPADVDESQLPGETPEAMTLRLALAKARAVASAAAASGAAAFILGADTAVVAGSALLGKPASQIEAARMLRTLSGCTHTVLTGLAVIRLPDRAERTAVESTSVTFARLSDEEIEAYASSGEPGDKAGGYAIQGRAARYVTRIEGCYSNVVGLPISRVYALLRELGWSESAT